MGVAGMYSDADLERLMRTTRANLEVLERRLRTLGYEFAQGDAALLPPERDLDAKLGEIQVLVGKLPAALEMFYRYVGSVDFGGEHPDWDGCECADPMVIWSLGRALEQARGAQGASDGSYLLALSPNCQDKSRQPTGGPPYGISLPQAERDPPLLNEWHDTTLLDYLRIACKWAGFPGLERADAGHTWPLSALVKDLKAF
jgi:hypothetical protein